MSETIEIIIIIILKNQGTSRNFSNCGKWDLNLINMDPKSFKPSAILFYRFPKTANMFADEPNSTSVFLYAISATSIALGNVLHHF